MINQQLLQAASVLVAFTAIIVGPIVSIRIAKIQIRSAQNVADLQARSNVLSKNRQEWINALRNEVAGFASSVTMVLPLLVTQKDSLEMHKLLSQVSLHL